MIDCLHWDRLEESDTGVWQGYYGKGCPAVDPQRTFVRCMFWSGVVSGIHPASMFDWGIQDSVSTIIKYKVVKHPVDKTLRTRGSR